MERRIYKLVAERGGGTTTTRRKAMTEWEYIKFFLFMLALVVIGMFTLAITLPIAYRLYNFLCAGVC